MDKNFWIKLNKQCKKEKRGILALAPMAGITDSAFRQICIEFGADVVYSEMASVTALVYNPEKTLEMLASSRKEASYVIQIFGSNPAHFAIATKLLSDKKLSLKSCAGIDINFGCPVRKVMKQGAGAVLMDDIRLAKEIIRSTAENTDLPVSIKIRSKAKKNEASKFLEGISDLPVSAVMIHGRSLAQGFAGGADFEAIKKARNYFSGIILANGGINTPEDAKQMLFETGADGIGIARGAMGRPWIFDEVKSEKLKVKSYKEIFKIILKHARLVEKLKGERGILEMRAHLCAYMNGLPGARKLRGEIVRVKSLADIKNILNNIG